MVIFISEPPSKPVGPIKVLDVQKTSAKIQWQPPKDDGGVPLKYYLLEKRDASRLKWTRLDKIDASMTTYCAQNLTTGMEYFFRVFAENQVGQSPPLEMDKPILIKSPFGK